MYTDNRLPIRQKSEYSDHKTESFPQQWQVSLYLFCYLQILLFYSHSVMRVTKFLMIWASKVLQTLTQQRATQKLFRAVQNTSTITEYTCWCAKWQLRTKATLPVISFLIIIISKVFREEYTNTTKIIY